MVSYKQTVSHFTTTFQHHLEVAIKFIQFVHKYGKGWQLGKKVSTTRIILLFFLQKKLHRYIAVIDKIIIKFSKWLLIEIKNNAMINNRIAA